MRWSFEVIFNENVSETETTISASGISKYSKLIELLTRTPNSDINIKIIIIIIKLLLIIILKN